MSVDQDIAGRQLRAAWYVSIATIKNGNGAAFVKTSVYLASFLEDLLGTRVPGCGVQVFAITAEEARALQYGGPMRSPAISTAASLPSRTTALGQGSESVPPGRPPMPHHGAAPCPVVMPAMAD